jgi:hypothetical protein
VFSDPFLSLSLQEIAVERESREIYRSRIITRKRMRERERDLCEKILFRYKVIIMIYIEEEV